MSLAPGLEIVETIHDDYQADLAPPEDLNLTYAFDVEVFPNFVSVVFINVDDDEDRHLFYLHPEMQNLTERYFELIAFVNRPITLVGYNSIGYDEYMLKALTNQFKRHQIYALSSGIVEDSMDWDDLKDLRYQRVPWRMIDLQKVAGAFCSLKQVAVNMKWNRIQDLPLPFDSHIQPDQIETIMSYNVNDVEITKAMYWELKDEIDLRAGISEQYKVSVYSESRSGVANRLLEKLYADQSRTPKQVFRDGRSWRSGLYGVDCIAENISFRTEPLQDLLTLMEAVHLAGRTPFKEEIEVGGVMFDIGVGGLHSRDEPGVYESDDEYEIIDADVASFYPMIMLLNEFGPEHLGDDFLNVFQQMTRDRLEAKKSGDKLRADALKITINSVFGKMNFDNYWLYDPKSFYGVTLSGQLYLLMLIERFVEAGIEVFSANTDGVVCRVHKSKKSTYEAVCDQWQEDTMFELEFTPYAKYVRKDVNNYIVIKPDGGVKVKGSLDPDISLTGGYKYPIVKEAIYNYFVYGKFMEETFAEADNILDFCIAQKVSQFKFSRVEFRKSGVTTRMQWTNRYYAAMKGGELRKIKPDGTVTSLLAGQLVEVINDVDEDRPLSDYDIDWSYYNREARAVIDLIDPPAVQLSLI